jgi:serpin B
MNQRLLRVMSTLAVLVALATALETCGGGSETSSAPATATSSSMPIAKEVLADEQAGTPVDTRIVAADNGLGLSLLNLLDQNATGNIAISPTSIALAFEMLYNGAAGSTQQGMSQALELGSFASAQDVDTANASLQAALVDADPNVTITIANSLWMHLAANPVLPSFTEVNQSYYAAEVGDLAGAPADVNAWVSQVTQGLIPQMLPPTGDYSSEILILANAIYFKGAWTSAFDPSATASEPFTLADGTQITCQMMQQHGSFDYYQGANFQMVRLPYGKQHLSMVVILPAAGVSLQSFVAGMSVAQLDDWISQLSAAYTVNLGLPKFKATYTTDSAQGTSLPSALTALGMGAAFDPHQADFSGVAPGAYVSGAVHATVVDVDETGTTAAAATVIHVSSAIAGPTATMFMNRPFFYAIRDDDNGALLFVGLLMNPTSS